MGIVVAFAEVAGLAEGYLDATGLDVDDCENSEDGGGDEEENHRNEDFAVAARDGFDGG